MSDSSVDPGEVGLPFAGRRGSLADPIETALAQRILGGELAPGATLPSQDELVRQFGVSRAVVREAIAALAQRGLLVVHHGRSTLVAEPTSWNVLDPFLVNLFAQRGALKKVLQDLFAVRLLIEPEAAAMVAMTHPTDQLRGLYETVERLERMGESPSRPNIVNADQDFHWQLS